MPPYAIKDFIVFENKSTLKYKVSKVIYISKCFLKKIYFELLCEDMMFYFERRL